MPRGVVFVAGTLYVADMYNHVIRAVALSTGAPNCIEGHLAKLRRLGVTEKEIEETVAVALGVVGASLVDRADIAQADWEARRAGEAGR